MLASHATTDPRPDNETLAVAAAAGDREALGELYERLADDIRRVAVVAVGGDRQLAQDLSGEAWVRVGRAIDTYEPRPGHTFASWVVTIVRNLARDHQRRASTRREVVTADMLLLDSAALADSPEQHAERRERAQQVAAAMQRLPKAQAEVLRLRFWCDLSVAETAAIMQKSSGAIGVLQHRALGNLRRALPDGGGTGEGRSVRVQLRAQPGGTRTRC